MPPPSLATVNQAIGLELAQTSYTYDERDVALYALGIGAPAHWLDSDELKFVYELSNDFQVLPSFSVIFANELISLLLTGDFAGIKYHPMMLVHGEQKLEVAKPLPRAATIESSISVADILDKGSGLLMVLNVTSCDEVGELLATSRTSVFIRGIGGFGGARGTAHRISLPDRPPDIVHEEPTLLRQALLYRLAGDANPLHADPRLAARGNYDKPILHGLCTYGFAARAILKCYCNNNADRLRGLDARFAYHVFPGETLVTEMWRITSNEVRFQTKAKERDVVVLSQAVARLRDK